MSHIQGIDIFGFTEPDKALEHFTLNKANYNTVVSDFKMPEMNGMVLLTKIKEKKPTAKTLLISAFEVSELAKDCNCVDKFLQKPIHISRLIEEVTPFTQ